MNLCQRNHNPGNLRFAGQHNATESKGFACFDHDLDGWIALLRQIRMDRDRNLTIAEFVQKYAPSGENDTQSYILFLCDGINAVPSDPLKHYSPYAVAGLIAAREGYFAQ